MYYVAKLEKEEVGGYSVSFPDVPGCFSQGDTLEEALRMAKEALDLTMEGYLDGKQLPLPNVAPDEMEGLYLVEVDQDLADRLLRAYHDNACDMLGKLDEQGFFDIPQKKLADEAERQVDILAFNYVGEEFEYKCGFRRGFEEGARFAAGYLRQKKK